MAGYSCELMVEHLNYETMPESLDSGIRVSYWNAVISDSDKPNKKYTLLKKDDFIKYVRGLVSDLNSVRFSDENEDVSLAIKKHDVMWPDWVDEFRMNFDTDVSQKHISCMAYTYFRKLLARDYAGLISEEFLYVPENRAVMMKSDLMHGSPAVALYFSGILQQNPQYENYASNPLYELDVRAFHDSKEHTAMVSENMDFVDFFPFAFQTIPNVVAEMNYLLELLKSAEDSEEKDNVFFLDDQKLPRIMSADEFYSLYASEDFSDCLTFY